MLEHEIEQMRDGKGFIAALDQSGGSTPKALKAYGINEDAYDTEEDMFQIVHDMRTRIITSPSFTSDKILGAILFENTMDRHIEGKYTADYLLDNKGILPFLKVDKGLADKENGVQMMKPMPDLEDLLRKANERHIFGTKMRSVIHEANRQGIKDVVDQQFEEAERIIGYGLIPIVEPEVNIYSPDKEAIEDMLFDALEKKIMDLMHDEQIILKLSIPTKENLYQPLMKSSSVIRIVALSGCYDIDEANQKLAQNHGMIASFSRALTQNLRADQTDELFNQTLQTAIDRIYDASIT